MTAEDRPVWRPTRVPRLAGLPDADLFTPVGAEERLDPRFVKVLKNPGSAPARAMIRRLYADFTDPDGNFREQFQTSGFDARIWELYLYAYLTDAGFALDRNQAAPDFMATRVGVTLAIEATTANPSPGAETEMKEESEDELRARVEHELPIKFGSPLFSKLNRRYWELAHVAGRPVVFAIESFASEDSLYFSETALASYLFGLRSLPSRSEDGRLIITAEPIAEHRIGDKVVPSQFFALDGAEHVSAVIFSNSGTMAKFSRMGYQAGLDAGRIRMRRLGFAHDRDPDADKPAFFVYNVGDRHESWGEGISVIHNPRALRPLADEVFPDVTHYRLEDGLVTSTGPLFHPFTSQTQIFVIRDG